MKNGSAEFSFCALRMAMWCPSVSSVVGGIGDGEIVVGPRRSHERLPQPMLLPIDRAHEVMSVGVYLLLTKREAGSTYACCA